MVQIVRGYCDRICNDCEIFKITQANDAQKRAAMAADLSKMFDQIIIPEDINCDGCTVAGGRLYKFSKTCSLRSRSLVS